MTCIHERLCQLVWCMLCLGMPSTHGLQECVPGCHVRACAHRLADTCLHVRAGWLNVLGQFANTAGAGFLVAGLVDDIWGLVHDGDDLNAQETLLVYSSALTLLPEISIKHRVESVMQFW